MRLIFHGTRIGYLRKILFKFRLRPGSGSGDSLQRLERCTNMWLILQRKLSFTDEEKVIIKRHVEEGNAAVLRAQGRLFINQKIGLPPKLLFVRRNKKLNSWSCL